MPGSIPALMDLQAAGIPFIKWSDTLRASDYHETWETATTLAWAACKDSLRDETPEAPNLATLIPYSAALAFCQIDLAGKVLDRIHADCPIDRLIVESGPQREDSMYWSEPYSDYFASTASAWAAANNVPVVERTPAETDNALADPAPPRARPSQKPGKLARLAGAMKSVHRLADLWSCFVLSDTSQIVDPYLQNQTGVLALPSSLVRRIPGREADAGAVARSIELALSQLHERFGVFAWQWPLLRSRVEARLLRIAEELHRNYHKARLAQRLLPRIGLNPVAVFRAPFRDDPASGAIADAFRKAGQPITEIQHGGNYNLLVRGMLPDILTTGLADCFFRWNDCDTRESDTYGIAAPKTRYINVGAPPAPRRAAEPAAPNATGGPTPDKPLTVLYAPTILSIMTTSGINAVWDAYLDVLDPVLAALDRQDLRVYVSVLDNTELKEYLRRRDFRHLNFELMAFGARLDDADVVIADSFGGSPIYQGIMSGKPMICYAATENMILDPAFVDDLRKHVRLYEDAAAYRSGIEAFARQPHDYMRANGMKTDFTLRDKYFATDGGKRFRANVTALARTAVAPSLVSAAEPRR